MLNDFLLRLEHTCLRSGGLRVVGARCTGSSSRSLGIACKRTGLTAWEVVADAALDTLGVCVTGGLSAIALVALGNAIVGCEDLRRVGARVTQACGLAVYVSGLAGQGAAHSGSDSKTRGGTRSRRNGGSLRNGESANGEREDNSCVLHFDYGCSLVVVRGRRINRKVR